jgi:hypothetical protein
MKVNIKLPFPVKVYVFVAPLFVIIIVSFAVNVAIMFHDTYVPVVGLYAIVPVGVVLSILLTVAITLPVLPAKSLKVKVKLSLPVKIWV